MVHYEAQCSQKRHVGGWNPFFSTFHPSSAPRICILCSGLNPLVLNPFPSNIPTDFFHIFKKIVYLFSVCVSHELMWRLENNSREPLFNKLTSPAQCLLVSTPWPQWDRGREDLDHIWAHVNLRIKRNKDDGSDQRYHWTSYLLRLYACTLVELNPMSHALFIFSS